MKSRKATVLLNNIISAILIGVIVLMVYFVVSSKLSGGSPKVFGKELLTVLSGSMEPGIQTGSIISITPATDASSFESGDVITYRSIDNSTILITHRIEDVVKESGEVFYITKGDNNDAKDPSPIPAGNVVGEYTGFTIPYIGYILDFVKSKIGTVLLIIIPGILMIGWSITTVWRAIAGIDESKQEEAADN